MRAEFRDRQLRNYIAVAALAVSLVAVAACREGGASLSGDSGEMKPRSQVCDELDGRGGHVGLVATCSQQLANALIYGIDRWQRRLFGSPLCGVYLCRSRPVPHIV
jgi:hypothetical protein